MFQSNELNITISANNGPYTEIFLADEPLTWFVRPRLKMEFHFSTKHLQEKIDWIEPNIATRGYSGVRMDVTRTRKFKKLD